MSRCKHRHCREALDSDRDYCDDACRSAEWKLANGYADPRRKGASVRNAAQGARGRSGTRSRTYVVLIEHDRPRKMWRELGALEAKKREQAEERMRANLSLPDDAVLKAVPSRSF